MPSNSTNKARRSHVTAYRLFFQHQRQLLLRNGGNGQCYTEISSAIAAKWKSLSDSEKASYELLVGNTNKQRRSSNSSSCGPELLDGDSTTHPRKRKSTEMGGATDMTTTMTMGTTSNKCAPFPPSLRNNNNLKSSFIQGLNKKNPSSFSNRTSASSGQLSFFSSNNNIKLPLHLEQDMLQDSSMLSTMLSGPACSSNNDSCSSLPSSSGMMPCNTLSASDGMNNFFSSTEDLPSASFFSSNTTSSTTAETILDQKPIVVPPLLGQQNETPLAPTSTSCFLNNNNNNNNNHNTDHDDDAALLRLLDNPNLPEILLEPSSSSCASAATDFDAVMAASTSSLVSTEDSSSSASFLVREEFLQDLARGLGEECHALFVDMFSQQEPQQQTNSCNTIQHHQSNGIVASSFF